MQQKSTILILFVLLSLPVSLSAQTISEAAKKAVQQLTTAPVGKIIKAGESEVYIALGSQQGVSEGNRFTLIRRGEPIKLDGEIIGYDETKIGTATAMRVQPKMAICETDDLQTVPRKGDMAVIVRPAFRQVMVFDFFHNKKISSLSHSVQQQFLAAFAGKNIQSKAGSLPASLAARPEQAAAKAEEIAASSGMDTVLLGSLDGSGSNISMTAGLFTADGKTIAISTTTFEAEKTATQTPSAVAASVRQERTEAAARPSGQTVTMSGFSFTLNSCTWGGQTVRCTFTITRKEGEERLALGYGNAKLYDMAGNTYQGASGILQNSKRNNFPNSLILPGINYHSSLEFSKVKEHAKGIALLQFNFNGPKTIEFRNIPYSE